MLKIVCFIIPLVLVAGISAEVYDDEGKIITEEEIKIEMSYIGTINPGSCLGGTGIMAGTAIVGYGALALLVSFGSHSEEERKELFIYGLKMIGIGGGIFLSGAVVGYSLSRYFMKNEAIERIKEKRRIQKQNEDKASFVPKHNTLILLSGSF